MLRHHRRLLFPLVALLLALPLLVELFAPPAQIVSNDELRPLTATPAMPRRLADLPRTLRAADGWLRDHFGFRRAMIHAQSLLARFVLDSGTDKALIGRDSWFFLEGVDDSLPQSAGVQVDPARVTATADMLATMQRVLAAQGAKLLVAPPPSKATIYGENLPAWARKPGYPTQYDLLLATLAARGIPALDLRPVLRADKVDGHAYKMHDSHWSPQGALAAFDAIVGSAGLQDWRMTPAAALGPPVELRGGDLARLLGINADVTEMIAPLSVPARPYRQLTPGNDWAGEIDGAQPGPTILVIGDSFSRNLISDLVAAHAGRFVWVHHLQCTFDWKWVEQFKPAQVWYMPTERILLCLPGAYPAGLQRASAELAR